jgi:hypothetical protein
MTSLWHTTDQVFSNVVHIYIYGFLVISSNLLRYHLLPKQLHPSPISSYATHLSSLFKCRPLIPVGKDFGNIASIWHVSSQARQSEATLKEFPISLVRASPRVRTDTRCFSRRVEARALAFSTGQSHPQSHVHHGLAACPDPQRQQNSNFQRTGSFYSNEYKVPIAPVEFDHDASALENGRCGRCHNKSYCSKRV